MKSIINYDSNNFTFAVILFISLPPSFLVDSNGGTFTEVTETAVKITAAYFIDLSLV